MSVPVVFNELSLHAMNSRQEANDVLVSFVGLLKAFARAGTQRILRVQEDFLSSTISSGYSIHDWCHDREVDKEVRLYLLRTGMEHPVVGREDACEQEFREYDFYHSNRRVFGLGAAHLLEGLCVSMNTSSMRWQEANVLIDKDVLLSTGSIDRQAVSVCHASLDSHVAFHQQWITERCRDRIQTGSDIWKYRSTLFANLVFCDRIERVLNRIGPSCDWFNPTKEILFLLNEHANELDVCFRKGRLGSREFGDESSETKHHPKCGPEHIFKCPDGEKREFFWHVKGPNPLRVYVCYQAPLVYIGHIGHLPISSSPHFYC